MATLSYDGQSLILDGKRIWLVSGSMHYARIPRGLWLERLRAARQAGLNCVEVPVFWRTHEPRQGEFTFKDNADLAHFISLLAQEGLWCVLRPGPFVGLGVDNGGLPAWLNVVEGMRLREGQPSFLEFASRYLSQVLGQVARFQATAAGGPILAVQAESQWYCHNAAQGEAYLREIVRYLREAGCDVPVLAANNLWTRTEGAIETWNANQRLVADLRQLHVVQPHAPVILSGYETAAVETWGGKPAEPIAPQRLARDLVQTLAAGGQYTLQPFHGGTNFGSTAGRVPSERVAWVTTRHAGAAPLQESGLRGPRYDAVKRVSVFADHFGHVLANLDPQRQDVVVAPRSSPEAVSIIHQHGTQGDAVFLVREDASPATQSTVLLPNGLTLTVHFGSETAAWFLLDANLYGAATLSHTNLRPWAFIKRRLLVLYGPPGVEAIVAIDDAPLKVTTPTGQDPLVHRIDGLVIVILNEEQVDAAYPLADGLVVGVAGVNLDGSFAPRPGWPRQTLIGVDGSTKSQRVRPTKTPAPPALGGWRQVAVPELLGDAGFKALKQPMSLDELAPADAYGWLHFTIEPGRGGTVMAPGMGDRLHLFQEGKPLALLGEGPGAKAQPTALSAEGEVTALVDVVGRFSDGWRLGEQRGVSEHFYAVREMRLPRAKTQTFVLPDPSPVSAALGGLGYGHLGEAPCFVWTRIKPAGRLPLVLDIEALPVRAMVLANRQPVGMYDPRQSAGRLRLVLNVGEHITGGQNELRLCLLDPAPAKFTPGRHLRLHQCVRNVSDGKAWQFAPWRMPRDDAFEALGRAGARQPAWYRCQFDAQAPVLPMWLDLTGMSKGQIFLNGHDLGRYWVATATGKAVGPQRRFYLPEVWLNPDGANVLTLFDEHGNRPTRCRLTPGPDGRKAR